MNKNLESKLKDAKGVSMHNGSLRIQFKLPGDIKPTRKSLGIKLTKKNIDVAIMRLGSIRADIACGLYDNDPSAFWRKHFPADSANNLSNQTVNDYLTKYIVEREDELSLSVQSKLKSQKTWLTKHKVINIEITKLTHIHIEKIIKESLKTLKQSTVNDYSLLFKRIIKEAVRDDIIKISPFDRARKIKAEQKTKNQKPEPFTQAELLRLLDVIHIEQSKDMIEFSAWTGIRPGELKALAWEDVDLAAGIVHIKYNLNRGGQLKSPKTDASVRKVELMPVALEILKRQQAKTYLKPLIAENIYYLLGEPDVVNRRRVFLSRSDKPYKSPELTTAPKQWENWLRKAKLIHREPYQLRHTFASQMLMVGADPTWLAKQLGHADWGMIRKIYGQWISGERPDYRHELAIKLGQFDPSLTPKGKAGTK